MADARVDPGVPVLSMMPAMVDFGHVSPNPTPPQTFMVTNHGNGASAALAIQVVGSDAFEFTTSGTCAGLALAAGASCDIDVTFDPGVSTGSRVENLEVSAANHETLRGFLRGSCCAPPGLRGNPHKIIFGPVAVGAVSPVHQLTVTNDDQVTTGPVSMSVLGTTDFHLDATTCGNPLAPAATCTIDVTMRPTSTGPKGGNIDISASPGGFVSVGLQGDGGQGASLITSPDTLEFSDVPVGTQSQPLAILVQNQGDSNTGTPTGSISGANPGEFQIMTNTCAANLAPGDQCSITIGFTPWTAGTRSAMVVVSATPGGAPAVALAGNGVP